MKNRRNAQLIAMELCLILDDGKTNESIWMDSLRKRNVAIILNRNMTMTMNVTILSVEMAHQK